MHRCTTNKGSFKNERKQGLTITTSTSTSNSVVNLLFDEKDEKQELFEWQKAIIEAQEMNRNKDNRLKQKRNDIALLVSLNSATSIAMPIDWRKSSDDYDIDYTTERGK